MLSLDQTGLEEYSFGDEPNDNFYILINRELNPDGINLTKLAMADPMRFDSVLNEMGCILLLGNDEVQELIKRGELDEENLHESLFRLAVKEGVIR